MRFGRTAILPKIIPNRFARSRRRLRCWRLLLAGGDVVQHFRRASAARARHRNRRPDIFDLSFPPPRNHFAGTIFPRLRPTCLAVPFFDRDAALVESARDHRRYHWPEPLVAASKNAGRQPRLFRVLFQRVRFGGGGRGAWYGCIRWYPLPTWWCSPACCAVAVHGLRTVSMRAWPLAICGQIFLGVSVCEFLTPSSLHAKPDWYFPLAPLAVLTALLLFSFGHILQLVCAPAGSAASGAPTTAASRADLSLGRAGDVALLALAIRPGPPARRRIHGRRHWRFCAGRLAAQPRGAHRRRPFMPPPRCSRCGRSRI